MRELTVAMIAEKHYVIFREVTNIRKQNNVIA